MLQIVYNGIESGNRALGFVVLSAYSNKEKKDWLAK